MVLSHVSLERHRFPLAEAVKDSRGPLIRPRSFLVLPLS